MANILVVDDIEDNVYLLKLILENLGHNVQAAYDGQEALDKAFASPPDIVLLDVMMPVLNGLEVAKKLKENESTRHVPVILLTARKNDVKDLVEGLSAGADEYLTKPFNEPELVARVNSMLRMKKLYDEVTEAKAKVEELYADIHSELEMAQKVQFSLLPKDFPYPEKVRITARYMATSSLGGDYYDVLDYGGGKIGILMADVSGHGPSAALIVSMMKALVSGYAHNMDITPGRIVELLNTQLLKITPEEQYVTMFLGILDLNTRKLVYIRAGHPYPLLMRKEKEDIVKLDARGGFVGLEEEIDNDEGEVELHPGDRILAYTDGLTEVYNTEKQIFGFDNMQKVMEANFHDDGATLIEKLIGASVGWGIDDSHDDDVAVLLVEVL